MTKNQLRLAQVMVESSNALVGIVDDILDIPKVETGKPEVSISPFDPLRTCEDVVALLRPLAAAKNLFMNSHISPSIPNWALGDPMRIRQVLVNLLGNAIKFTDVGGVRLHISVETGNDHGFTLRFEVKDTGVGIPVEAAKILFTPFPQVDGSLTRKHGGTGLGLFITRQLVELMGGALSCESRPGSGSRFWFAIPLGKLRGETIYQEPDSDSSARPPLIEERAPDQVRMNQGRTRILVCEDNPTNQKVIRLMLEHLGFSSDLAKNGKDAPKAMATIPYDLIFMDCQMPDMDGYEATRRIRAAPELRDIIIIAMTAHAMSGDKEKCLAAGMDDYISKPISFDTLDKLMVKWSCRVAESGNRDPV